MKVPTYYINWDNRGLESTSREHLPNACDTLRTPVIPQADGHARRGAGQLRGSKKLPSLHRREEGEEHPNAKETRTLPLRHTSARGGTARTFTRAIT